MLSLLGSTGNQPVTLGWWRMYSVFLPIQRLFLRMNEGEFTSLQLADWLIPFSGADLKIPTNHSEEQFNGTGTRLGYLSVPFGVSSYPLFKELAIWPN